MTWLIQKIIYQIDIINDREHPSCNGITLFVRQLHRYYEKLMYVPGIFWHKQKISKTNVWSQQEPASWNWTRKISFILERT